MANADAGISLISALQKMSLAERLEFPLAHDLVRFFRDKNHHVEYEPFRPVRCMGKVDFLAWPVLRILPAVKKKYPKWSAQPKSLTLSKLLQRNHEYVAQIASRASDMLTASGLQGVVYQKYQVGELHIGPADMESWSED
jgi:hypothetical protein